MNNNTNPNSLEIRKDSVRESEKIRAKTKVRKSVGQTSEKSVISKQNIAQR